MNSALYLLVIWVAYFALLLLIGHFTSRKSSDNNTFFLAGKSAPWWLVSIGMIGTSISGVTFISVPGMPLSIDMTYMQTALGFFVGYIVIAKVLLPLYYRLELTSIYTYLERRFGIASYKTGAIFFFISKMVGAAARLYLVVFILQRVVLGAWHIPFGLLAGGVVLFIWLYSRRGGIRTIVRTDALQTLFMIGAMALILVQLMSQLHLHVGGVVDTVRQSGMERIFVFSDWHTKQNFFKQFFSGIFITIVMSGLDQDVMQKNLSIRTLPEAQKSMYIYGSAFIPVNLLFLVLGILLFTWVGQERIPLPEKPDELLPLMATSYLGVGTLILFSIGIVAAAFSSADSALTSLTTSFCVDLLRVDRRPSAEAVRLRKGAHVVISLLFFLVMCLIDRINDTSIIDTIYTLAGYTYGPLLGLFAYGLFRKGSPRDRYIPYLAFLSPVVCYLLQRWLSTAYGYALGYELLMLNGLITFVGLSLLAIGRPAFAGKGRL
ncbi:MAG: sodium:solute symporter [Porphyromonadaceae bacterium]|nr:sodium:solute symporter [Porphyromonadaceae bacterium]